MTDLDPFVPSFVRAWPAEADHQHLSGTMASVDLSGFTRLSERLAALGRDGAEELVIVVNSLFEPLIEIAHEHGGDVLHFGGDALLVWFAGEAHALRATVATARMQQHLHAHGSLEAGRGRVRVRMSVGVHTGAFDFLRIGTGTRYLAVVGRSATDTVDLEGAAPAGAIAISAATASDLPDHLWTWADGQRRVRVAAAAKVATSVPPRTVHLGATSVDPWLPPAVAEFARFVDRFGEHRRAAIAFLKLGPLDAFWERDRAGAIAAVGRFATSLGELAGDHDVSWLSIDVAPDGIKFILTAGAPISTGADEERMLRTVRRLADLALPEPLELHIGAHAGTLFVGDVGGDRRRALTVMGDAVNLTARLMAKADGGEIVATPAILDASATRYDTAPLPPFLVKGKREPISASVVGAERERAAQSGHLTDLVGRNEELDVLTSALQTARSGTARRVDVVGSEGTGKSRLLAELRSQADGVTVAVADADPYLRGAPYGAIREALRVIVGLDVAAEPAAAGEQLVERLRADAPGLVPWASLLAIPLGATAPPSVEVEQLEERFVRPKLEQMFVDLLDALRLSPTLLVVDDVQWADDASCSLLDAIGRELSQAPMCLVVAGRPPTVEPSAAPAAHLRVDVGPLLPASASELALACTRDRPIDDRTLASIVERSAGNPQVLLGMVDAWRDGASELPASAEAIAVARIDRLPPADRSLLRAAAVLGRRFRPALVAAILEDAAVADPARWTSLDAFVRADGADLRFRHNFEQAAAYAGLALRRRRVLHGRAATALEHDLDLGRDDDLAGVLAMHTYIAGRHAESYRHSLDAAGVAEASGAFVDAGEHLERAGTMALPLGIDRGEQAEVWIRLAQANEHAGRQRQAGEALARASRLASDDPMLLARIALLRATVAQRETSFRSALAHCTRGERALGARRQPAAREARAALRARRAAVLHEQGRFSASLAAAREADALLPSSAAPAMRGFVMLQLEMSASSAGAPDARALGERALDACRRSGVRLLLAQTLNNQAVSALTYDWGLASTMFAESAVAYGEAGDVTGEMIGLNNRADIAAVRGDHDTARTLFDRLARNAAASGDALVLASVELASATIAMREGDLPEGRRLLEAGAARSAECRSVYLVCEADIRRAELLILEDRAEEGLAEALALAERLGRLGFAEMRPAHALLVAGWARLALGRVDAAVEELRAVRDVGIAETDELLELLARATLAAHDPAADDDVARRDLLTRRVGMVRLPPLCGTPR